MLLQESFDDFMGVVMMVIICGGAIIFIIWAFISKSMDKEKAYEKKKSLIKKMPEKNEKWDAFIKSIEQVIEPSCKCNMPIYRIFEIYDDLSIEYRCLTCTRKGKLTHTKLKGALTDNGLVNTDVIDVFNEVADFESAIDSIETLGNLKLNLNTAWDIDYSSRGPWYRGIQFKPSKPTEYRQTKRRRNISTQTKQFVWERDQGQCAMCGAEYNLEYDHIIPFSKGGSNGPKNIQLLCRDCNSKKRAKIL